MHVSLAAAIPDVAGLVEVELDVERRLHLVDVTPHDDSPLTRVRRLDAEPATRQVARDGVELGGIRTGVGGEALPQVAAPPGDVVPGCWGCGRPHGGAGLPAHDHGDIHLPLPVDAADPLGVRQRLPVAALDARELRRLVTRAHAHGATPFERDLVALATNG